MSETNAQRELARVRVALEKLYAWTGTKSSPMPESDLRVIKEQIGGELDRLVARSDMLELAPLLREVTTNPKDGIRTVTFDMRDGTSRSFQTMVDWLDSAPVAEQEFDQRELMEAREFAESQRELIFIATERAAVALQQAAEAEERAVKAETAFAEEREARDDERAAAAAREEDFRTEILSLVSSDRIIELEQEVETLRAAYLSAAKVVDDAIPGIVKGTEALHNYLKQKKSK